MKLTLKKIFAHALMWWWAAAAIAIITALLVREWGWGGLAITGLTASAVSAVWATSNLGMRILQKIENENQ